MPPGLLTKNTLGPPCQVNPGSGAEKGVVYWRQTQRGLAECRGRGPGGFKREYLRPQPKQRAAFWKNGLAQPESRGFLQAENLTAWGSTELATRCGPMKTTSGFRCWCVKIRAARAPRFVREKEQRGRRLRRDSRGTTARAPTGSPGYSRAQHCAKRIA